VREMNATQLQMLRKQDEVLAGIHELAARD
jgi:hypothetical protein